MWKDDVKASGGVWTVDLYIYLEGAIKNTMSIVIH